MTQEAQGYMIAGGILLIVILGAIYGLLNWFRTGTGTAKSGPWGKSPIVAERQEENLADLNAYAHELRRRGPE